MSNLGYLFLAFAAIWTGLFIFLLLLAGKLSGLQKQVKLLKQELKSESR